MIRIALYQPDIAQNVGSLIRLSTCFSIALDIIEPCGFPFDMRRIRQTAMDYIDHVDWHRHASWEAYLTFINEITPKPRLCLLTTKGSEPHHQVVYTANDILLCGRESAGVPDSVHDVADQRIKIPLASHARSFNVASAATIVLAEALRQTNQWPE